jgi:predicted XRE-type DNA-binding protein
MLVTTITKRKPIFPNRSAFHSLGLADADDLVLRAELMRKIGSIIAARGLTQAQAAALMGMDQPRVSALLAGKITKFSADRLLRALSDLGQNIELRITPARGRKGRMRVAA